VWGAHRDIINNMEISLFHTSVIKPSYKITKKVGEKKSNADVASDVVCEEFFSGFCVALCEETGFPTSPFNEESTFAAP